MPKGAKKKLVTADEALGKALVFLSVDVELLRDRFLAGEGTEADRDVAYELWRVAQGLPEVGSPNEAAGLAWAIAQWIEQARERATKKGAEDRAERLREVCLRCSPKFSRVPFDFYLSAIRGKGKAGRPSTATDGAEIVRAAGFTKIDANTLAANGRKLAAEIRKHWREQRGIVLPTKRDKRA